MSLSSPAARRAVRVLTFSVVSPCGRGHVTGDCKIQNRETKNSDVVTASFLQQSLSIAKVFIAIPVCMNVPLDRGHESNGRSPTSHLPRVESEDESAGPRLGWMRVAPSAQRRNKNGEQAMHESVSVNMHHS